MLSFFRTKSSEANIDKVVNGTKDLSLDIDEIPIDIANMQSHSNNQNTNDLLNLLGYQNETELKETIYGKLKCDTFLFMILFFRCLKLCHVIADMLRTIRDPEKPSTLEDLKVVYEEGIFVQPPTSDNVQVVSSKIV